MKTQILVWMTSMFCLLGIAANVYAAPSDYEWGTDENGSYIRLYTRSQNPVRVYVEQNEVDLKVRSEVQSNYAGRTRYGTRPGYQNGYGSRYDYQNIYGTRSDYQNNYGSRDDYQNGYPAAQVNTKPTTQNNDDLSPFGPREQFLFYYNKHSEQEKVLYEKLYHAIKNVEKKVELGPNVDYDRILIIMQSVIRDHPELFWFDWYSTINSSDNFQVIFKYYDFVDNISSIQKTIDNETQKIIQEANQFSNVYEKVRYVYEYIALNSPYSSDGVISSLYQFFIRRTTSCAGNTTVFHYLLNQLGIPARYVIGDNDEHSWNQVILEGTCYNIDVTGAYNNTIDSSGEKYMDYDYFGLSDSEIRKYHHNFEQEYTPGAVKFPACNGHIQYEEVFRNAIVSNFYKKYMGMSEQYNVAFTLQDYFNIMHHSVISNHSQYVTTYIIVVGKKLKEKIYNLSYKEIKNGYLGDISENYRKGYKWKGSGTYMELSSELFLVRKKDEFK